MKAKISIVLLLVCVVLKAQEPEKVVVKNTIDAFFTAFHKKDTLTLKKFAEPDMVMQSIGKDKNEQQQLTVSNYKDFLRSIASIPDDVSFEEKLKNYTIQIDGDLAHVWTPYEFWLNDALHHCGVNSFQLFKNEGAWRIIYLVDTKTKENCSSQ